MRAGGVSRRLGLLLSLRVTGCATAACMTLAFGVPGSARAEALGIPGTVRVDGLAAVVGGLAPGPEVISIYRSDVALRARFALLRAGAGDAALGPLPSSLLKASLDELVGEALVASESMRLSLAKPSAEQVRQERQRLAFGVGGEAQLQEIARALNVDEADLAAIAERKAVVSGFLTANLEGTLEVSPAELEQAFEEQAHPFGAGSFSEVKEQLRAWLTQRRMQASVARWVESLRARTPVRRLADF